jgi:hypothetical protein
MSPDVAALLAQITKATEDLHFTESHLRRQRTILREQATALRLGVAPAVVAARLRAAKVWAVSPVLAGASWFS